MSQNMGGHKIEVFTRIDLNSTQMGHGVSCPHKCVKSSNGGDVGTKSY
jgi:hypothetical protein